ncbi:MAG: DUF4124 domain-containing protein [Proteobacteria bacterium]|nr:DUF4124 domain-containing protein [Pseudomonadota bacterium]
MNLKKITTLSFAAALLITLHTSSFAGIYKWVDENGQVHYGEKPVGAEAEKVTIRQNTTTKPRVNKKDEDATGEDGEENNTAEGSEDTEKAPEPKEVEISKKEKRQLCNEARADVAAINSRGRMREISATGEYSYLSDGQKQKRLSAAKKKQSKYCR